MRGDQSEPDAMFSYVSPAQRVPKDHPLRAIRTMVDEVLLRLWSDFEKLYSHTGRRRFRPSGCCGHCSFRCCTPSAASGC